MTRDMRGVLCLGLFKCRAPCPLHLHRMIAREGKQGEQKTFYDGAGLLFEFNILRELISGRMRI